MVFTKFYKLSLVSTTHTMSGIVAFDENLISKITSRIFLTTYKASTNLNDLQDYGITHVLSIYLSAKPLFSNQGITYKIIDDILDMPDARNRNRLSDRILETNSFIHNALTECESNKILIHCKVGCSRSVTFLVAYLMSITKKNSNYVIQAVKQKRIWINPNPGFRFVLDKFYRNNVNLEFDRLGVSEELENEINEELFGKKNKNSSNELSFQPWICF